MDFFDPVHLEDLASDAFDTDDLDDPHPVGSDDYSGWPTESSPAPVHVDADGGDWEDNYMEDFDAEAGAGYDEQDQEEQDIEYEEHENEEPDYGELDEYDEEEDGDSVEYVLAGEDELEEDDSEGDGRWDSEADPEPIPEDRGPSPSPGRDFLELLAEFQGRRDEDRLSEAPSDSLFVDQNLNSLPPFDSILSSVRRRHDRAINLLSGYQSQLRRRQSFEPFGHGRPSLPSLPSIRALGINVAASLRESDHRRNQRHHPYNTPRDMARERGRTAGQRNNRNDDHMRDELVAVELQQPPGAAIHRSRTPPHTQPVFIDLTGEPDSPEEPRAGAPARSREPNPSQNLGRNPRRRVSVNQRTPALSRTDGSLLGNSANVIDLTVDDSPAPPPLPQQLPRRDNAPNNNIHRRHHHHRRHAPPPAASRAQPINLDNREDFGAGFLGLVRSIARPLPGIGFIQRLSLGRQAPDVEVQFIGGRGLSMDNPLAGNIPNLNYHGNGQNAAAARKPEHVPPPKAREGFTRSTGGADDAVICPGCGEELKYDPDAEDTTSPPTKKKPRTRKDQEEHHFWALKECGHVYCKACYECRRAGAKSSLARFRRGGDNNRKLLCAVEDCPTEVNNKLNWVGLFL